MEVFKVTSKPYGKQGKYCARLHRKRTVMLSFLLFPQARDMGEQAQGRTGS